MKRNMTAAVMALAMSTVMSAAALSGCGSTPKETVPETAKEQQTDAQTADATGESGKDEESSAERGIYEEEVNRIRISSSKCTEHEYWNGICR